MKKIAIFGSGKGSNAENLIQYFKENTSVKISLIVSNISNAGILSIAKHHQIPSVVLTRKQIANDVNALLELMKVHEIDFIILAGYLLLIPAELIDQYENKMINIHPALLPNYGGKGMYGMNVHHAIINNKETQSGISIHLVNREYDKGKILFQAVCPVLPNYDAALLANKIHDLEYKYFPKVVEDWIGSI